MDSKQYTSNSSSSTPDVTVVMCTYNRAELLQGALESLYAQQTDDEFTYEILVVDNSSTDDTQAVLEELANASPVPMSTVIETSQGVAFARNRGIAEANGEWIHFIDDDEIAAEDCVLNLLRFARKNNVRVVGGAVDVQLPESCPPENRPVYQLLLSHTQTDNKPFRLSANRGTGTGNLLLHRSVLDEVGTFDESLAQASEDSNLMHRIYDAGIDSWYTPEARVFHLIEDYRISPDYIQWVAQRHGWNLAQEDHRRRGSCYLITRCLGRLALTATVSLPKYFYGKLSSDSVAVLLGQFKIHRAIAYVRGSLRQLVPPLFQQEAFAESLNFRSERETFGEAISVSPQKVTTETR